MNIIYAIMESCPHYDWWILYNKIKNYDIDDLKMIQ